MADWTFGVGRGSTSGRSEGGSGRGRKSANTWVEEWSERFRQWWQSTDMSQSELAKKLSVSPMTISRWTRGRAKPTAEAAVRLGQLLDQMPSQSQATESNVTDQLLKILEGVPHGKRIGHLFESIGRVLEQVLGQAPAPAPVQPTVVPTAKTEEVVKPAVPGKKRGRKPKASSAPVAAPALVEAPKKGKPKASKETKPEVPAKVIDAPAKSAGGRKGKGKVIPELTWPEVILAIQNAEGWGEGRNRKLADALKVAPSTISNWLGGHRRPRGVPREMLASMARKHDISVPA